VPQTQENQDQFFAFAAGSFWPQPRVSETWSRGKNSRLGSSSLKTASHLGFAVCNSTTALGLRAGWVENRGGAYRCARYYDPSIGRFISEDPLAFNASLNFYAYVRNSPIGATDALGLYDSKDVLPAWNHYCDGTGTPWTTSFASINWGETQNNINAKVKGMVGGGCAERTIPVNFNMSAQTGGADAYIIGRHTVKAQGTIQVHCDCTWSFSGNMSSAKGYDPYDFDPSNRGAVGETLTWIGAHRCPGKGTPFNINLPGSVGLSGGGTISGKPTCDCKNK
jgi:RHS repeat-associated protein